MSTIATVEVDDTTNEVRIRELTIRNDELVDYLGQFDDNEQEEAVIRALKVGAATLQLAETSKDLEYVKREFESMQDELDDELDDMHEELEAKFGEEGRVARMLEAHFGDEGSLRDHLEDAFGDDGLFSERLDEELGEDGAKIKDALDPDTEGTPTYRLKQTLKDEIQAIRDKLTEAEAREEVRQKTTLKGDDFEDLVAELLDDLVYNTAHSYEYTGETEGELSGRDVGDFVIQLGDTGQRIVVEAKSEKGYSTTDIKAEMEAAIENRRADYGIFVSECESYLPNKVGYLTEYDQRYVCVSVSEDEDDEVDPRLFRIGYNWAKMRAAQGALETGETVDTELVQTKVAAIEDEIDRFRQLKSKCTTIRKNAEGIRNGLTEIADDVNNHLNDVTAELTTAE